jgi:hypothetical protein
MIVLAESGTELLAVDREEDGDGVQRVITIFRYAYDTDEVTAQFYLTEEELAALVRRVSSAP